MKKLKKVFGLTALSSVICFGVSTTPLMATENDSEDKRIKEISEITGIDEEFIKKDVKNISEKLSVSYDEALDKILVEMQNQEVVENRVSTRAGRALPAGAKGNAFYTQAYTSFWNHGHTGVFSSAETIIHAPGQGNSLEEKRTSVSVTSGDYYLILKNPKNITSIISKAKSLTGKPFSYSIDNKSCSNNNVVNCSQLVYCAFKSGGYDVDSNGGMFVSPADIKNSGHFNKRAY